MHITTFTGIRINPLEPEADDIDIRDIAHALSYICRGNGQVRQFFSVASHSIMCALEAKERGYSDSTAMFCLLHDASECYLSDVPGPVKGGLAGYAEAERRLQNVIYTRLAGRIPEEDELAVVEAVDKDLLYWDLKVLLDEKQDRAEPELSVEVDYSFIPFAETENRFLEIYYRLKGDL